MGDLTPGTHVGSYVIERQLGSGGMATVFLARHAVLESKHAIKVLEADLVADDSIRDRFLAEGRIQAQVAHPNIVRVTDILAAPGIAALVMEYVEGPTLRAWLDAHRGGLTESEISAVMSPLLRAVESVHTRGIIHRDLKPANIIIAGSTSLDPQPMLLDFGVARLLQGGDVVHTPKGRTRSGAQLGTAGYMSPEQIRGEADLDPRTDVFALGAVLYELATGRVAFDSDSEFDTMRNVVDGNYTPPDRVVGSVSPRLARCIRKALAGDCDARYSSCGAFAADLEEALAPAVDESVRLPSLEASHSEEPLPEEERSRGVGRRWAILALVMGVLAAVSVAAIATLATVLQNQQRSSARADASEAMEMLRQRQLDADRNRDPSWLAQALTLAQRGERTATTPESTAAVALLTALHQGWHLQGKEWDPAQFQQVDAITARAVGSTDARPEALLARAIVLARACRIADAAQPTRGAVCGGAERALEAAHRTLAVDQRWWLHFEATWIWVDYLNDRAREVDDAGAAAAIAQPGLGLCAKAVAQLGRGSVNESVLRGACMTVAGHAGDYGAYVAWARRIRRHDEERDGAMGSRTVRFMYQRAGPTECMNLKFGRYRRWDRTFPVVETLGSAFCTAVGLYALDCPSEAAQILQRGRRLEPEAFDWSGPQSAWSNSDALECYLTADVAGP